MKKSRASNCAYCTVGAEWNMPTVWPIVMRARKFKRRLFVLEITFVKRM